MSDAKTAAEIEDILYSIRRLVSQDRKPAPRPQVVSRLVVEDRLILTPDQRVSPERAAAATVTQLKPRVQPVEAWPEERAEAPTPSPAPVAPAPVAPESPARLHLGDAAPASLAWEAEMGDPAPDVATLDWSSFTFARRPMAETYAARSRAAERLSPPRPPSFLAADFDRPDSFELRRRGEAAEAPAAVTAPPAPQPAPVAREAAASPAVDLTAAPAEPVEEPALQEEDSIFSEDVLRELVRDLIREQLQGELGERITRNIRKLVKAEIARSLSVQQLD